MRFQKLKDKTWATVRITLAVALSLGSALPAGAAPLPRPKQYILFAFDGSYTLSTWKYSREFAQQQHMHFTYFINPVYLLQRSNKQVYTAPHHGVGKSAIGWGDNTADITERIEQINSAHDEGHEIGSHAVGHWDGSKWDEKDWTSELTQFFDILGQVFTLNQIKPDPRYRTGWSFARQDIIGFRAPQLGINKDMYHVLPTLGFKYDTSQVEKMFYWPRQNSYGTWNFPLSSIHQPGATRTIPTMDYNFCYYDSALLISEDPSLLKDKRNSRDCLKFVSDEQKTRMKNKMLAAYRNYFESTYYGNRAPMHIGHHFSRWMSGAYYETFFEFAHEVCGMPEVECINYRELTDLMGRLSNEDLAALQKGNFERLDRPKTLNLASGLDLDVDTQVTSNQVKIQITGPDAERAGLRTELRIDGKVLTGRTFDTRLVVANMPQAEAYIQARVLDRAGRQVQTATYLVRHKGNTLKVQGPRVEDAMQIGDPPQAHAEDRDSNSNSN
jgi:peptidoglycan/xylan/chitin deacetylase (PgdA/CDA1 family)